MMYISEYFYSNCLIEAIKAKIRHPIKIKIKYIPARLNEVFCPHLMWHDGEYTYDFLGLRAFKAISNLMA